MKLKRVINFFGGPGTGKSTMAAALFVHMKQLGMSVELVSEYAKQMVFEDRLNVLKEDQLYVFAKQHRKLFTLKDTVEYVITDSPFVHGAAYMGDDAIYNRDYFNKLIVDTHNQYPNFNIFLVRPSKIGYEQMGRYQSEEEANSVAEDIALFLKNNGIKITVSLTGTKPDNIMRSFLNGEEYAKLHNEN